MAAGFRDLTEEQLRAHLVWLRQLASFLVRDGARADDAVQETLSAAWRSSPSLDRDVKPWLARVLRNFVRTGARADSRRQTREHRTTSEPAGVAPSAEDLLSRHETAQLLARLVSDLGEPQRSVVLLHLAEGLTLKEIARQRGVPEGTIRWQFKRAVDDLRLRVERHYAAGSRDWRLALLPLAHSSPGEASAAGLVLKGAIMSVKGKVAAGVTAIVALVLGVGVSLQDSAGSRTTSPESRAVGDEAAAEILPAKPPGSKRPPRAPTLINALAATVADNQEELARCSSDRQGLLLMDQPEYFTLMRPSTRNQTLLQPLVERVMSRFSPKPSYSLECRVSSCRFAAVSADEATAKAWFEALTTDEEISRLRGGRSLKGGISGISSSVSKQGRDSLTGAPVTTREYYLTVPFIPPSHPEDGHPFDTVGDPSPGTGPATLADCRRQIAEIEGSLARKFPARAAVKESPRVVDVGIPGGLELSAQERSIVKAANERAEVRAREVSRELLAELKGTGAPGPGEMTREEGIELWRFVNGEWNRNRLREGRVADLLRRHKKSFAQYWKEMLASELPHDRAREIVQALRDKRVSGLSLPRPPLMGANPKGEQFMAGWANEDWQD